MLQCQRKSHSSLYTLVFSLSLAFSCLPPQPLTLSTPDLQITHVIMLYKPKDKVEYIVSVGFIHI